MYKTKIPSCSFFNSFYRWRYQISTYFSSETAKYGGRIYAFYLRFFHFAGWEIKVSGIFQIFQTTPPGIHQA